MKRIFGLTTALSALTLGALPAFAQGAPSQTQEIIVTATKRPENVQNVAAAVEVLTAGRLQQSGVSNILTLQGLTPGVHVQTQGAAAFIYIHGVGSQGLIGDPSAPLFVDGVYVGRGTATSGLFFDVARVEMLKGPQGTLYGRNATAGAVNIVSNAPTHQFGGAGAIGFGSYGHVNAEMMLNAPLSDTLAVRGAVQYVGDDGYLSNGSNQNDDLAARAQALWTPNDNVSLRIIGDYYKKNGPGPSTVPAYAPAGGAAACSGGRFCRPSDPWYTPETPGAVDIENWGIAAELNWNLGPATLTVLPAHRSSNSSQLSFANNIAFGGTFLIDTKQDSVEARLASNDDGPLHWLVGAYYHHEDTSLTQIIRHISGGPGIFFDAYTVVPGNTVESYAAFAEGTYSLTDRLRATLGVRYTSEDREQTGQSYVVFTAAPFPLSGLPANPFSVVGQFDDSRTTWNAGLQYDLTPNSMIYINAGTGFKSGGINREKAPNTFNSEDILAYALGTKNLFMDGRLLFNAEAFYWDYDGRQNEQFAPLNSNPPPNTGRDIKTFNLGESHIYGVDADLAWQVTDHDRIEVGVSYLHAEYANDPANNFPATTLQLAPLPAPAAIIEPGADLRGKTLAFSPEWSGVAAYSHQWELNGLGALTARIESQMQTKSYTQYRLTPQTLQPSYTKTSFSLTYETPNRNFSVMGYVRNIEDEPVLRSTSATALTTATPLYYGYIEEPRTYGVEFRAKF